MLLQLLLSDRCFPLFPHLCPPLEQILFPSLPLGFILSVLDLVWVIDVLFLPLRELFFPMLELDVKSLFSCQQFIRVVMGRLVF